MHHIHPSSMLDSVFAGYLGAPFASMHPAVAAEDFQDGAQLAAFSVGAPVQHLHGNGRPSPAYSQHTCSYILISCASRFAMERHVPANSVRVHGLDGLDFGQGSCMAYAV